MVEPAGLNLEHPAVYLLRPHGLWRVGAHPDDLARSRAFAGSDTLFGALTWAFRLRFGEAAFADWLAGFVDGRPPALWSSALPALEERGGALHVFVPTPLRRPGVAPEALADRKLLRRVRYLHPDLLPWFSGAAGPPSGHVRLGALLLPSSLAERLRASTADGALPAGLWEEAAARPRVTVDRLSGASALFSATYAGVYQFPGDAFAAGLAIAVLARDQAALQQLDGCLEVLGEAGIGGERSTGSGQFTWRRADCPLPLAATPAGPLLSLCWPRPEDLAAGALHLPEDVGYRLTERTGWVWSPDWSGRRTRTVAMLAEGSHLAATPSAPVGGLADVTPDPAASDRHRVYRYGYGLFLNEGQAR